MHRIKGSEDKQTNLSNFIISINYRQPADKIKPFKTFKPHVPNPCARLSQGITYYKSTWWNHC